jgi:CubicO group peptidase (beta-lactamase class C family)
VLDPPKDTNILFWSESQRDAGFKVLDELTLLVESRTIESSSTPRDLPMGESLTLSDNMDDFFAEQRLSGALILHKGEIRYERYAIGHSPDKRWTSFSVAKSFTSSLVGIALKEGHIKSLDDSVSTYIKGLAGSAYDDVTIAQLLTMTSGVDWNESYTDPNSDVAKFNFHKAQDSLPTIVSYMRNLKRAHPPGEKWLYSTGETNLIGILVERATGQNLSEYLSEKIWQPFGMEKKATWLLGSDGNEISGCCMQASLRDFARYGLFILENGEVNGESVLPNGWLASATTKQADIGLSGRGYGYQWWTFDDGSFTARGIFGQTIFIDPNRDLVVAFNGNWSVASDKVLNAKRFEFIDNIRAYIDKE